MFILTPPPPKKKDENTTKKKRRMRRWTEWVSEKHEFREDSWDEANEKILKKHARTQEMDPSKFIAYQVNGAFFLYQLVSPHY